jgi:ABC-type bacteriocin/lantibiotic exporter with double-glycine peptidase domain
MKNSVVMCINIYTSYKDAKREYNKLDDIISKLTRRIDFEQKKDFLEITIESLKYTYPNDKNDSNIPFSLVISPENKLNFKLGQVIKLDGNSGNGKSTFTDIINGIIPFSEYTSSIFLDYSKIDGFDCLTSLRYYNEQSESMCWKPSVYEIISGRHIEYDDKNIPIYIDKDDENIVWDALTICLCLDFLKKENITNELKWIHTRNIGMSGGQKGRISLARSVYRIMTRKPIFITLDEVDKAIQSELVVPIMQNIYRYTRENNILLFVICHNPDVKKLQEYDQVINFVNGMAIKKIF